MERGTTTSTVVLVIIAGWFPLYGQTKQEKMRFNTGTRQ